MFWLSPVGLDEELARERRMVFVTNGLKSDDPAKENERKGEGEKTKRNETK